MAEPTDMSMLVPSGDNLPSITFPMVLDFLRKYTILHRPATSRREFKWFSAVSKKNLPYTAPKTLTESSILFVCHDGNARALLDKHQQAFALCLTDKDEIPQWLPAYCDRLILVKQKDTFAYFIFLVQTYFMNMLIWASELDRIVLKNGSLDDLLEVSAGIITHFMYIHDSKFNLIAHSKHIAAPDNRYQQLIEVGCLQKEMIRHQRFAPPDRKIEVEQATDKDPFTRLHFPIFINSVYFGSMILVCSQKSYSKGLEDLFAILSKRIASVCDSIWKQQVQIESPHHFFFTRLLNGEKVTNSYTQIQMSRTAIPQNGQLKLLLVELDDKSRIRRLPQITEAASRINHGDCYHFVYRGDLLILCYAEEGDSQLSHRKSYNDLNRLIYKAFDVPSSASQIFENITDIDMAYKQAKVSLGLKNTIKSELFATGEKQNMGVYLFEDALLYYLIDPSEMDKRFLEFSFSHTVLQKIYAEDQQNGTNNLALFWFYLHHERNATAVAQRLHMHRNTVLYHIDKIQKRFDFDLSLQSAREKMLVDFKTFFLRSNHESVEKIFADTREDTDEHLTL